MLDLFSFYYIYSDVRTTSPLYFIRGRPLQLIECIMSWLILFIAGVLEAGWLVGIQKSESFTHIPYVILAIFSMALSLILFSIALKDIPISHAYLVWLAVGASSIAVINHYFFEQLLTLPHLFCFGLILVGVLGLKVIG